MTEFRKAHVTIDAIYRDGTILKENHSVPARVSIHTIPPPAPDKYRELALRMVVDTEHAEELLEGLCHGSVTLSIERIPSAIERESKL